MVCDRFADSTRVYQGVLGHVDPRLIKRVALSDVSSTFVMEEIKYTTALPLGYARAPA